MDDVIPLKQFGISEVLRNPFQRSNKYGAKQCVSRWSLDDAEVSYCDQIKKTKTKTIFPLMSNKECKNTVCFNLKVMRILTKKKIKKKTATKTPSWILFLVMQQTCNEKT